LAAVRGGVITYHYRAKDILWRAAAEHAFGRIKTEWDSDTSKTLQPLERLREEYRVLFRYTASFPEFHRFMRQECTYQNPRLEWVAETVVKPLLDRLLPQIKAAQKAGLSPAVQPILYMMVSLTATLSEFGPEMVVTSGICPSHKKTVAAYSDMVESTVFKGRK
jgi:TetR/AcrR family transcriptional regulator